MFRLIASGAQQGLRPSLILKVKPPTTTTTTSTTSKFTSTTQHFPFENNNLLGYQVRNNSSQAGVASEPKISLPETDVYQQKLLKYNIKKHEPYHLKFNPKTKNQRNNDSASSFSIDEFLQLLQDETFRNQLNEKHLFVYASNLYSGTINLRRARLNKSKNRDKDQRSAFREDMTLQSAVLNLTEIISTGELNSVLSARTLFKVFGTLLQFKLNDEIVNLWETGVNSDVGKLYLAHEVLSIVIQVGHETRRFNYDEIKQIYEMSVKEDKTVHPYLSDRMGQVAVMEGDYVTALDALESLMNLYEQNPNEKSVLGALAQIHLSFIGHSKDLAIAERFFEKGLQKEGLPYSVIMKAPYMTSFLSNCIAGGYSMEEVIDFWRRISKHYLEQDFDLISSQSTLHAGFFKSFFEKYPEPSKEAIDLLNLAIESAPKVNEVLLNTLISNLPWADKEIFNKFLNLYQEKNVTKSIVSHRIILKQSKQIEYTNEEILQLWNELLGKLDEAGYTYIANADWSALRASTMFSGKFSYQRTGLYLSVLGKYKDYMQNNFAAIQFLRNWVRDANAYRLISKITLEENPQFDGAIKVDIPEFDSLRPNINYREVTKQVTDADPRLLE